MLQGYCAFASLHSRKSVARRGTIILCMSRRQILQMTYIASYLGRLVGRWPSCVSVCQYAACEREVCVSVGVGVGGSLHMYSPQMYNSLRAILTLLGCLTPILISLYTVSVHGLQQSCATRNTCLN